MAVSVARRSPADAESRGGGGGGKKTRQRDRSSFTPETCFFFLPFLNVVCRVALASHMGDADGKPEPGGEGSPDDEGGRDTPTGLYTSVWLYIGDAYRHRCIVIHSRASSEN